MKSINEIVIFIFLISILILGFSVYLNQDIYYHFLYSFKKEEGNKTINEIVENSRYYDKTQERLNVIASMITENFTDPYFPSQRNTKYFCHYGVEGNDTWGWCSPPILDLLNNNPYSHTYAIDKAGRSRTMVTNDLSFDPYWIAYQKTGACQELSVFFNTTANRSGFLTRIVHANGISHWWNEVNFNGEWYYFDTQNYGIKQGESDSRQWFGNRSDYTVYSGYDRCDITRCGVYVFNGQPDPYGEDITNAYDPNGECPHGTWDSNGCPI
jgi:hypothetical protein